jgi:hypothetical protein
MAALSRRGRSAGVDGTDCGGADGHRTAGVAKSDLRPTHAQLAQLDAMLQERGPIEVYVDELGREAYRLTEEGVRVGHMLAMVEGEEADEVLKALLRDDG